MNAFLKRHISDDGIACCKCGDDDKPKVAEDTGRVCDEALGISLGETAPGADLGGSSKFQMRTLRTMGRV